jgi:NAD(P)H-flavin reductase
VRPEHYPLVGGSLVASLRMFSGSAWTPEVEAAWAAAYGLMSDVMIAAAQRAADSGLPAWWEAEVVRHERRADDLAVLTVRPEQPYPFLPGQYATVTVPQVPQVWRPYSMANAPRRDNTLDFHVRRVSGGAVSTALTEQVRPGGRLRLGPAIGTMALPARPRRDLLCVAGGTGWAPVKAIIEANAALPAPRAVTLFLSARSEAEVYDIDDLERLAKASPWLDVVAVLPPVGTGPEEAGAELLRELDGYAPRLLGREVYISGPPVMTWAVEELLLDRGFDGRSINRDAAVRSFGAQRPTSAADHFLGESDIAWIRAREVPLPEQSAAPAAEGAPALPGRPGV